MFYVPVWIVTIPSSRCYLRQTVQLSQTARRRCCNQKTVINLALIVFTKLLIKMNDDNLLPFMDKENQSGNVLRPRERLGSVPESPGTMEGSSKSYSYMMKRKMTDSEINSILDGGEKRLAVIDPNQPRTSRKRLAQKVLSSPLQIISGRKKASVKAVNIEVDGKRKDRNDDRKIVLNESQRKQAFAGKMKGLVSKLDIEREFDIFVKTINEVQVNDESKIFDSCPEVVSKVSFQAKPTYFCNVNHYCVLTLLFIHYLACAI